MAPSEILIVILLKLSVIICNTEEAPVDGAPGFDPWAVPMKFVSAHIKFDVWNAQPDEEIKLTFNGNQIEIGDEVRPDHVLAPPLLSWEMYQPDGYYTVIMADPKDSFCPEDGKWNVLWVVANVHGTDVNSGTELIPYRPPRKSTINDPYVVVAFQQKNGKVMDNELKSHSADRCQFNMANFVAKHQMRGPTAGTFFYVIDESRRRKRYL